MNMSDPPVPQHRFVALGNGHRMHYHEAGAGPAVMFLHGSGPGASGFSNFKGNFPVLAERGFRALVPDSLGFGHSDKPEDVTYTAEFHVDAFRRFLDALGVERLSLIGNSHGGAMALAFALAYPERVERLVLMAPGGLEERDVYMAMPGIRAMMKAVFGSQPMTLEGLRKVFELQLYNKSLITDQTLEERFQIAKDQPKCVIATQTVPSFSERLSELQCPILAFWGMNDQFCPPSGAWTLATRAKRCKVLTVSECGHWVMVEYPDLFNRLCADFLRE